VECEDWFCIGFGRAGEEIGAGFGGCREDVDVLGGGEDAEGEVAEGYILYWGGGVGWDLGFGFGLGVSGWEERAEDSLEF